MSDEKNSLEEIARENGWKPEEEWKGDPPKNGFKTADEFVKAGFDVQKSQHEKIEQLQGTVERVENNINEMAKTEATRTAKALERQKQRLERERQEAFEESDSDRFNELDKELDETKSQMEETSGVNKEFKDGEKAFIKRNDWYNKNKVMTAFTMNIADGLGRAFPDMSADEYFEELEKAAKEQFPNQFRNERRDDGSPVDGGRPKGPVKKKGFDSLPPEAKEAFEEAKFYAKSLTKEDYAKSIFEMELE